jgi:hypothetical protein
MTMTLLGAQIPLWVFRELLKARIMTDRIMSMQERYQNRDYNKKTFRLLWVSTPKTMKVLQPTMPRATTTFG